MKYILTILYCFIASLFLKAQLNVSVSSELNMNCNGVDCVYDGPSILINEIMLSPAGQFDGSLFGVANNSANAQEGEWIELFNPDECRSVDISCYYLGNNASDQDDRGFTGDYGGGYRLPMGVVVPPLGFVVIRGKNAPVVPSNRLIENGGNTIELVPSSSDVCIESNTRLWFPNAGGWFAFYDENGVVQDAISWATNTPNYSLFPCVSSNTGCSNVNQLASYNQIPGNRKTRIANAVAANSNRTYRRVPDGGNWRVGQEANPTMGDCNGNCIPSQNITCTGSANVTVSGGVPPYNIIWNDSRQQTGNSATQLCAGIYCATITDAGGNSTQVCVEVFDFKPDVQLDEVDDLCVDEDPVELNGSPTASGDAESQYLGTGVSGDGFNPQSAGDGDHLVRYIYTTEFGCSDTDSINVIVHPIPEPTPIANPEEICKGNSTVLSIEEDYEHSWNKGVQSNVPFNLNETDVFTVTANVNGCIGVDSIEVTVIEPPYAGLDSMQMVCENSEVELSAMRREQTADGEYFKIGSFPGDLDQQSGKFTLPPNMPLGNYQFYYVAEPDEPCLPDTAIFTIGLRDYPEVSNVVLTCLEDRRNFIVEFDLTGGDSTSYKVVGNGGIFTTGTPNKFEGFPVQSNTNATYTISDLFECRDTTITVTKNCDCESDPGSFQNASTQHLCGEVDFNSLNHFNLDSVAEEDDAFKYFLHLAPGPFLLDPIDSNTTGVFAFDNAKMSFNTTYYVSTVIANDVNGNLDPSDPCYTVSRGVPVMWHELPQLNIYNDTTLCETNNEYQLKFDFVKGSAPFNLNLDIKASTMESQNIEFQNLQDSVQFFPTETTTYAVVDFTDDFGCVGEVLGNDVEVEIDLEPVLVLDNMGNHCINGTTEWSSFYVDVTGEAGEYDVYLSNSYNSDVITFKINTPGNQEFPVHYSANDSIRYEISGVNLPTPNVCPVQTSGAATFFPFPTINIGRDSIYCEGQPILINTEITGVGPWSIHMSTDNGESFEWNSSSRDTVLQISYLAPGTYVLSLDSIVDLSSNCVSYSASNEINLTINPSPRVNLYVLDNGVQAKSTSFCDGDGPAILEVDGFPDPNQNYQVEYQVVNSPNNIVYPRISLSASNNQFQFDSIPGVYEIYVSEVKDNSSAGCAGIGDTIRVTINPLPTLSLNNLDPVICIGEQANIEANLTGVPNFSFDIQDENGLDPEVYSVSGGVQFNFTVSPKTEGTHRYVASNLVDGSVPQCVNTTNAFFDLEVEPLPEVSVNGNGEWCNGDDFSVLMNIIAIDSVKIVYRYGSFTDSLRTIGSSVTVTHNLPPGNYDFEPISIVAIGGAECEGTTQGVFNLTIHEAPMVDLVYDPNPACLNDEVNVILSTSQAGPLQVDLANDLGATFTIDLLPNSASFVDTARFGLNYTVVEIRNMASNPVGGTVSQGKCFSNPNDVYNLTVNDLPTAILMADTLLCEGDSSLVSVTLINEAPYNAYLSVADDQLSINSYTESVYEFTYTPTDSISYVYLDSLRDANGCRAEELGDSLRFRILPVPQIAYDASPVADCVPLVTDFTSIHTGTPLQSSEYSSGNNSMNSTGITDTWVFPETGYYDLYARLVSDEGCVNEVTVPNYFFSSPYPDANFVFTPNALTLSSNILQISNRSTPDAIVFEYMFSDSLNGDTIGFSSEEDPYFVSNQEANSVIGIRQVVENQHACSDTAWKFVPVFPGIKLYAPNSFTANKDGVNDGFGVTFSSPQLLTNYHLLITDRWGKVIFESKDYEETWDGYYKYEICKSDIYNWKLDYSIRQDLKPTTVYGKVGLYY